MSAQSTPAIRWSQRWRSLRNEWTLRIAARIRYSRGVFVETACGALSGQPAARAARIEELALRHGARFEEWLSENSSLNNYAYLDLLDRAFALAGSDIRALLPASPQMADVGCANFWYASALQVFFRPRRLDGYDVEAFRRYANGHTRQDYASGYAQRWPETRFHGMDYGQVSTPSDLITCWYPFLTPQPLLAWGLPLNLLKPKELFQKMADNLSPGGGLFMVNHGAAEAQIAGGIAISAGFRRLLLWEHSDPLLPRPRCPVASYWQR
jgi:hypothetical protein